MQFSVDGRTINAATGAVAIDRDEVAHAPLVVLLHGAGMNRSVWSQQTRWLAHHGTRALAVDLPGHGDSEGPALPSVGDLAAWAAALADALGDRIHVIGHSMGAFIALEAAATSPDRVASVVLLGVGATMAVHPDLQAAADADDTEKTDITDAIYLLNFLFRGGPRLPEPSDCAPVSVETLLCDKGACF